MADLMSALLEVAADADSDLITAPEVRVLIGRGPTCALYDLSGFPAPTEKPVRAARNREARPALYRRSEVEAWMAGHPNAIAATKARLSKNARERAAVRRTVEARSLIGLPSELAVVRSLRRDLFDEDPLTAAPAPCSHWAVLLRKAGASADGRDVSPKVLAAERRGDGRVARPSCPVGHHPGVVRSRPEDIESASRIPERGKPGRQPPRITLAGPVQEAHAAGI